jgi:hypothetical protein
LFIEGGSLTLIIGPSNSILLFTRPFGHVKKKGRKLKTKQKESDGRAATSQVDRHSLEVVPKKKLLYSPLLGIFGDLK